MNNAHRELARHLNFAALDLATMSLPFPTVGIDETEMCIRPTSARRMALMLPGLRAYDARQVGERYQILERRIAGVLGELDGDESDDAAALLSVAERILAEGRAVAPALLIAAARAQAAMLAEASADVPAALHVARAVAATLASATTAQHGLDAIEAVGKGWALRAQAVGLVKVEKPAKKRERRVPAPPKSHRRAIAA